MSLCSFYQNSEYIYLCVCEDFINICLSHHPHYRKILMCLVCEWTSQKLAQGHAHGGHSVRLE